MLAGLFELVGPHLTEQQRRLLAGAGVGPLWWRADGPHQWGYTLQRTHKTLEGAQHPDRTGSFAR